MKDLESLDGSFLSGEKVTWLVQENMTWDCSKYSYISPFTIFLSALFLKFPCNFFSASHYGDVRGERSHSHSAAKIPHIIRPERCHLHFCSRCAKSWNYRLNVTAQPSYYFYCWWKKTSTTSFHTWNSCRFEGLMLWKGSSSPNEHCASTQWGSSTIQSLIGRTKCILKHGSPIKTKLTYYSD